MLKLPGGADAPADGRRRLGLGQIGQPVGGNGLHLDVHVDAIQQGAGDAVQIAPNLRGRAAALLRPAAQMAAGTGIHGADQHETRRIGGLGVDAGDGHEAVLQRLAQRLQHVPAILRQLVQKQHAVVRLADLAGQGVVAAAHQRGVGRGVVGRAKGPLSQQAAGRNAAGHGVDARGFQRLGEGHVRQNGGHAPRHQRLARAGRADEQHVVPAGRGDFQRALGAGLALDVAKIGGVFPMRHDGSVGNRLGRRDGQLAGEMPHGGGQVFRRIQPCALDAAHLVEVGRGQQNLLHAALHRRDDHRQRAAHGTETTVQRELAEHAHALQRLRREHAPRRTWACRWRGSSPQ